MTKEEFTKKEREEIHESGNYNYRPSKRNSMKENKKFPYKTNKNKTNQRGGTKQINRER